MNCTATKSPPQTIDERPQENFTFMWPCIVTNFFIIKLIRCTNFTNLFWYETQHVSDSSSVHHQEFIHCTLSNGICHTAFEQEQSPARKLSTNLYDTHHCWVYREWTPDDGQKNCLKHVEFHAQIKFVKLVLIIGFIIKRDHKRKSGVTDKTFFR
jgi:hypothetical protein